MKITRGTLFILLALFCACPVSAKENAHEPSHKVRVLLIGVDALSLNVLDPFLEQGLLPKLQQLIQRGFKAPLASYWPLRTMQVWTSIVTGKLPGQHGIWDHVTNSFYNPPEWKTKKRHVYVPSDRRSKALWQLLSQADMSSLVVGWPTTWPAEKVEGQTIVAPRVPYGEDRRVTIKGGFWRDSRQDVQPANLRAQVHKLYTEPQEITAEELAFLAEVPPKDSPLRQLPKMKKYLWALRWNLARSRTVERVTLNLSRKIKPDVVLAYFQCPDSLAHRFWIFQKSEEEIRERLKRFDIDTKHAAELKRRFGHVIPNCYKDVERRVDKLIDSLADENTLVLLVSDHGFGDGPKPHPFRSEPYGGIHWSDGAMVAVGPGVTPGKAPQKASALDITPSILRFLGLPVAEDMKGKSLDVIFRKGPEEKTIPTYEDKPQTEVPYAEGYPKKPKSFVW